MKKVELEKVGRMCPKCGGELVYRHAKKSGIKFVGCSNYPKCDYAEFPKKEVKMLDEKCPVCGKPLVERHNRRGQPFVGCSGYPECTYIKKNSKINDNKEKLN